MHAELRHLVDEVRLSFHAFSEFARDAHGDRIDPPGRAVLEFLSRNRPSTVPAMARSRGVTRQHIQAIVNALESEGLVEASRNPAHKRSPLFSLTADGHDLIESIGRTEATLLDPLRRSLDAERLTAAAETLAGIRDLLTTLEHES